MTEPPRAAPANKSRASALVAVVGIACAGICAPFVTGWEDGAKPRLTAYRDIGGVWTGCGGITAGVRAGEAFTPAQCSVLVDNALAAEAQAVLNRDPTLQGHPYQLAAATSLAHNIGLGAYRTSTVAVRFAARQWAPACDAFLMWSKVKGRVVAGLLRRRRAERDLCLTELPK